MLVRTAVILGQGMIDDINERIADYGGSVLEGVVNWGGAGVEKAIVVEKVMD